MNEYEYLSDQYKPASQWIGLFRFYYCHMCVCVFDSIACSRKNFVYKQAVLLLSFIVWFCASWDVPFKRCVLPKNSRYEWMQSKAEKWLDICLYIVLSLSLLLYIYILEILFLGMPKISSFFSMWNRVFVCYIGHCSSFNGILNRIHESRKNKRRFSLCHRFRHSTSISQSDIGDDRDDENKKKYYRFVWHHICCLW